MISNSAALTVYRLANGCKKYFVVVAPYRTTLHKRLCVLRPLHKTGAIDPLRGLVADGERSPDVEPLPCRGTHPRFIALSLTKTTEVLVLEVAATKNAPAKIPKK